MALLSTALPPRALPFLPMRSVSLRFGPATAMTAAAGIVGAGLDTAHGAPARVLFAVFLTAGALLAVATVDRADLVRTVVMVPLAYFALLVLGGLVSHDGDYRLWLATAFVFKAPVVLLAAPCAAVAAVVRSLR